ncbi:PQQ-dependent sugar dehydrogenase [Flavobacterium sp. DG1-102-2]|uniref:PQQ-dependent sugar dehydrogenase n=1 Tax=Flavobacterium sp. DG1-102-2 TaxID=3081663 RepID=UPI00294A5FFC|nr:PQQ-dependent sugar dehydrogenase [Flavobacterium sp. DG1-102-2]MDV6167568.1 PQQ-dependent sugar dehydrogenase [Flavobacterium sp. DG1-102-2]
MRTKLLLLSLFFAGIASAQTIELELFASDFESPTEIVNAGDDRLFVVEQSGHIRVLNADGTVNDNDFLDVSSLISFTGERGLLGLAFHPNYAANGYFYIDYTNTDGSTVIARYSKSEMDNNTANPASAVVMLTVEQPFENHNGGCLRFGPDGYLYIAMGDGGSGGDPGNRAQNLDLLLGKILRLDVDAAAPYIPTTNPFVNVDGADEIWAYGLRNPWKFSFDENGDLWIADVGQGAVEEINKMPATTAGVNYGWKCYEGDQEFDTSQCSDIGVYTGPTAQYLHAGSSRCSITGGYVYHGTNYPNFSGKYFFADFCTSEIGYVGSDNILSWAGTFEGGFTTFGEDSSGELYIAGGNGNVYKITDTAAGLNEFANSPFAVYPNPANNQVFISSKEGMGGGSASIANISGQVVLEQYIDGNNSEIDTSKLQGGVYVLSIDTPEAKFSRKLIIR